MNPTDFQRILFKNHFEPFLQNPHRGLWNFLLLIYICKFTICFISPGAFIKYIMLFVLANSLYALLIGTLNIWSKEYALVYSNFAQNRLLISFIGHTEKNITSSNFRDWYSKFIRFLWIYQRFYFICSATQIKYCKELHLYWSVRWHHVNNSEVSVGKPLEK